MYPIVINEFNFNLSKNKIDYIFILMNSSKYLTEQIKVYIDPFHIA